MSIRPPVPSYKKAPEKVLEILEDEILSGKYKPGERLVEREIAARLGVSRVPVREALITLERWGFVKEKGANEKWREIAGLTKKDIIECYGVRCFIECQAFMDKAMEADTELLESLSRMMEQMNRYAEEEDVENYRKWNRQFHHEFVLSLKNNRLYRIYTDISRMLKWFQNITLYYPRMKRSNEEHKLLLNAYKKQDLCEIRRLFRLHYEHAMEMLSQRVDET